jgi:hypothetical protein
MRESNLLETAVLTCTIIAGLVAIAVWFFNIL